MSDVTELVDQMIYTLLWSECDDGCEPLEHMYCEHDVLPESRYYLTEVAESLLDSENEYAYDIAEYVEHKGIEQLAHDFILTANGHGAGFWDRGLGELGERLTAMAKGYGSFSAQVRANGSVDIF